MSWQVTIIDAGVGNLGNLERAVRSLGADPSITQRAEDVASSHCLMLPGVGAFRPPRERLRGGLEEAIHQVLEGGGTLMGICVGYQLLFESSEEFGHTDGLGLLRGHIRTLPNSVPLPHIGWNRLFDLRPHPLLRGVEPGSFAYFVHTFAPDDVDEESSLALCRHGRAFPAVSARGRVFGTQFHPEKSSDLGLRILENYLRIAFEAEGEVLEESA